MPPHSTGQCGTAHPLALSIRCHRTISSFKSWRSFRSFWLNHDRRAQAETDHRALQKIERAVAGIMAAIEDGLYQPSMKARMDGLELQKAEITERLSQARADLPDVHPNIANAYRKNVARFTEVLADPDGGREAAEALRSLIGGIVLNPARSVARSTLSCAAS